MLLRLAASRAYKGGSELDRARRMVTDSMLWIAEHEVAEAKRLLARLETRTAISASVDDFLGDTLSRPTSPAEIVAAFLERNGS